MATGLPVTIPHFTNSQQKGCVFDKTHQVRTWSPQQMLVVKSLVVCANHTSQEALGTTPHHKRGRGIQCSRKVIITLISWHTQSRSPQAASHAQNFTDPKMALSLPRFETKCTWSSLSSTSYALHSHQLHNIFTHSFTMGLPHVKIFMNIMGCHEKGRRGRLVCFCEVCLLVHPKKGRRGRLVCFCEVCLLVHPEKGRRGRLVCFCEVCPLVCSPTLTL